MANYLYNGVESLTDTDVGNTQSSAPAVATADPTPAQAYTPNPSAMAMGLLVGQAVRRMRK